jgi:hypothetical protein
MRLMSGGEHGNTGHGNISEDFRYSRTYSSSLLNPPSPTFDYWKQKAEEITTKYTHR